MSELRLLVVLDKTKASELLSRNIDNRELDFDKVNNYRQAMELGVWDIEESKSDLELSQGIFRNGQHRLYGFLESALEEMKFYMRIS